MPFDIQGARQAGYSDAEIADEIAKGSQFDTAGAREAGYTDAEIISELQGAESAPQAPEIPVDPQARAALFAQLQQRLGAADEAGRVLQREEGINGIARPVLRGAVDLADGVTSLPRLIASVPGAIANPLLGTNLPLPITQSVADIADATRGAFGASTDARQQLAPRNDTEQLVSTGTQALGGVLSGAGIGGLLSRSASPVVAGVGNSLGANLSLQTAGALTGAGSQEAARRGGLGPIGQTVAGFAGSLIPGTAVSAANRFGTGLTRTPEAQRLLDAGVDLTPGQLNPGGRINQVEEGTQSIGLVGPAITGGRQNARATFQRAAIQEGAAPGTTIRQANPAAMLDEAYQSYQPLYDAAHGFPVKASIVNANGPDVPLSNAFQRATANRSILASADDRANVASFLDDQLTRPVRNSEDLLRIRSDVRARARLARQQSQPDRADLLDEADTAITQSIESQLPPQPLASLRTADANYGNFKILERAVARAKDRDFTPNDLSQAVAAGSKGTNLGDYARGGGGRLRELAADGRTILDARSPPTGARLLALAPGAALAKFDPTAALIAQGLTTGGVVAGAATQTGRRLAQGATAPQQFVRQLVNSRIQNVPQAQRDQIVSSLFRSGSQLSPTASIVRDMLGIPEVTPNPYLGLDQDQENELRAGLLQ